MQTSMYTKQYEIGTRNKCKPKHNKPISTENSMQPVTGVSNANEIPNQYSISNSNSKMLTKSLTSLQNIETFEDRWGLFATSTTQKDKTFDTIFLHSSYRLQSYSPLTKHFSAPQNEIFCFVICYLSLPCRYSIIVQMNIPDFINLNSMCWFPISHGLPHIIGLGSDTMRLIKKII